MAKMHVKSGDKVVVLSGKDKGKEGTVLRAKPAEGKVLVEGVAVAKKAVRYIAGIAVVVALAIMVSLIPLPHYASSSLLFFMAGASVTFIYPAIALKAGLFR